jgi:hypothetical protein
MWNCNWEIEMKLWQVVLSSISYHWSHIFNISIHLRNGMDFFNIFISLSDVFSFIKPLKIKGFLFTIQKECENPQETWWTFWGKINFLRKEKMNEHFELSWLRKMKNFHSTFFWVLDNKILHQRITFCFSFILKIIEKIGILRF